MKLLPTQPLPVKGPHQGTESDRAQFRRNVPHLGSLMEESFRPDCQWHRRRFLGATFEFFFHAQKQAHLMRQSRKQPWTNSSSPRNSRDLGAQTGCKR
jgi:hypothetical protein